MSGSIFAAGLNHTAAPVAVRERLALDTAAAGALVERIVAEGRVQEVVCLSTCNRVELYGVAENPQVEAREVLLKLAETCGVAPSIVLDHAFVQGDEAAVRHIFRVSSSLESLVLGEPQILGQVKDAARVARTRGWVGPLLDRCLTAAFRTAKRVRTETAIARGAASVPSVAVDLAISIFGKLTGCGALLVGAGEMAEEAAVHLRAAGVSEIVVVNRSPERGRALASKVEGRYVQWSDLDKELSRADIVVTSTGSSVPVIRRELVRDVMKARRHRPIFLVDIAVPRDVEPEVAEIDQAFVYNIDDLQGIVHDNLRARSGEAERASILVEEEVVEFVRWQRSRSLGPVILRLQEHGHKLAEAEFERIRSRLGDLSPEKQKLVEQLAFGVVKKLLHTPIATLREVSSRSDDGRPELVRALSELFDLESDAARDPERTPNPAAVAPQTERTP